MVESRTTNLPEKWWRGREWIVSLLGVVAVLAAVLLGVVAFLYLGQHSMIYHPRPYTPGYYARALPPDGVAIDYSLPFGKQRAYYIPGHDSIPKRLWVAFCGNGSLALDWTTILQGYPKNGDGFLLIDYPGYGNSAGYATIESTRETADAALDALAQRVGFDRGSMALCTIGHSLGAGAALDFAAHHTVQRIVLIAPFTSLQDEAARMVGGLLARILVENYDNRRNLSVVYQKNARIRVAIFHGSYDTDIPVGMGRELKREFPAAAFFPVDGADHVSVLSQAREQIIAWMNGE